MKTLLLSSFLFLLCAAHCVTVFSQANKNVVPPNQPEQDACNAIILCGSSFYTPYSYQGTGTKNDLNNTPCGGGEDNSVWLTFTIKTSGKIIFRIVPVDKGDDYDFAVLNTTNTTCDKVKSSNVVRCNFNANENNNGTVGLSATSALISVPGGTAGSNYCKYIDAVAGETYLVMINNFGHDNNPGPSSGFTIDFTGSSATYNQPPPPAMDSIVKLACGNAESIILHLTNDALCTSIAADGSDFSISPAGVISAAAGVNCNGSNGYTRDVVISFTAALAGKTYTLSAKQGTDANTIIGLCGSSLTLPENIAFSVPVPSNSIEKKYICFNQLPYIWNGISVIKGGDSAAIFTAKTAFGCDSVIVLDLTVSNAAQTGNDSAEFCAGKSYILPWDSTINSPGTFSHTYQNVQGCDSLMLTIKVKIDTLQIKSTSFTICGQQSYKLPWDSIINKTGTYTHVFYNKTGCDSLRLNVTVKFDIPIVQSSSVTLCGPQSYKLPWDSIVNRSGKYTHSYHFTSGCDSLYSTITITIDSAHRQSSADTVCGKQPYKLPWDSLVTKTGNYTHTYQYNTGCDSLISDIFVKFDTLATKYTSAIACNVTSYNLPWDSAVNKSGIYSHTYHYASGCDSFIATANIFFDAPPNIKRSYAFCQDSSVILSAGNNFDSYQWSTGANSADITVSRQGTYTVQATDSIGCYALDTFKITVYPLPVSALEKSTTLCTGSEKTLDAGNGFINYLWNTGGSGESVNINDGGIYWVTVSNDHGCYSTDSIIVANLPLPADFLPNDTIKCFYDAIVLKPNKSFSSYRWSTGFTGSAISAASAGIYSLKVTDAYGCAGADSVSVKDSACKEYFYIPSAFTPNADGKNDIFRPAFRGLVTHYSFIVYNRWGQKIFSSSNAAYGWDGTVNGQQSVSGVYIWICSYQLSQQQNISTEKGTVVLVR